MTLDELVNLAESDKGSFYNQNGYRSMSMGKGMFYSEEDDDKNCTSS